MPRAKYKRVINGLRAAAFLGFVLLGGLIWFRYAQALKQIGTASAAQRVGEATSQILTVALDVRNAAQGFALTGDETLLAHTKEWRAVAPSHIQQLQQAAAGDPEESARALALLTAFGDVMTTSDHLVTARQDGGLEAVQQLMQDEAVPHKLDDLRSSAATLVALARQRVLEERATSRSGRTGTGYLMLGTFLSAVGMLAYAGAYMRRELRRQGDAEEALLKSRGDVDEQIALRTRELHAARAEAETASRIKDDFLAAVSHELRTPLNAIVGWTHILKIDRGENRTRAVEAIERNAQVQTRLIDDLLDVSRMIQGRFGLTVSPIDLRTAVQAAYVTVAPMAAAKGVTITVRAGGEALMRGDEARLQQVAWNLLSNAVKFTPAGGSVTVEITHDDSRAQLRVTDTGAGIAAALLPHIFDPFRQGPPARSTRVGLGLGLAIVRQIVELHGGTVQASSDGPQKGACFVVVLPTIPATVATSRAPVPTFELDHLQGRVLVVEDDADGAETLAALLSHSGCDVCVARSVKDAVIALAERHPDLVLCDIGLPDGDGYSVLRELRRRFPGERVPAIAMSALARDEDRRRALDAGFAAYITKPYEAEYLFEHIHRVGAMRTH